MPQRATASPSAAATDGRKRGNAVGARRWWIFAVLGIAAGGRIGDLFARKLRTTPNSAIRELDRRSNDGIDVRLLWNSLNDRVSVAVEDRRTGEFFELPAVDPEDALIAFHHPYAYASRA
jgi:hypothetical protein